MRSAAGLTRRAGARQRAVGLFAAVLCAAATACESDGGAGWSAPAASAQAHAPAPCAKRDPLRSAYFGDLHVHTAASMNAYAAEVPADARDAYAFARGAPLRLAAGAAPRSARLERPLDFAAVTDHASYLAEVSLCTRPDSPVYDEVPCRMFRGGVRVEVIGGPRPLGDPTWTARLGARLAALGDPSANPSMPARSRLLCGEAGRRCAAWGRGAWRELQEAAEEANDPSADCAFATFHAYEYAPTPQLSGVHRNVLFRSAAVAPLPIAHRDVPDVYDLWQELRSGCLDAGTGCDAISIPHNSNLSNGRMFPVEPVGLGREQRIARARLRAQLEPLVEVMQIKGDSECRNGLAGVRGARDELCDFERYRAPNASWEDCGEGVGGGALVRAGCISKRDFVRHALVEGLRAEQQIGINPFKLGLIASSDAHNGNPGDVEERSFDGWRGAADATPAQRLRGGLGVYSPVASNPGGLVGVWAEENRRDALFDALKRRETFGTSGPRIEPRFFGGWAYPEDLCDEPELLSRAYAGGVPMGGDLPPAPAAAGAPRFLVAALRDAGSDGLPGGLLQRIQIVKGWPGEDGDVHQKVVDVVGSAAGEVGVDPATCRPTGPGYDRLCRVWSDPEFDPDVPAVYYARVVENPSCRWSAWQCLELPAAQRPPACADPEIPKLIQERAWTSPIWYSPAS